MLMSFPWLVGIAVVELVLMTLRGRPLQNGPLAGLQVRAGANAGYLFGRLAH